MSESPNARSDTSIMLEVRNGDLGQLGILFDRYHHQLFAFFVRMTGSPAVSEDLVQEVFLRVLKYRTTFRPDHRFTPWLYQIARNARNDDSRKNRTDYLSEESKLEELHAQASINGAGAPDAGTLAESQALHRALANLAPEKREILLMARFEGLTHKEIGSLVGCDAATVKVRVFRAIQELRKVYLKITGEKVLWNAPR